jgi:A/G-specific adenine glycosylase
MAIPVDSGKGKKLFSNLAQDLLDKNQAGTYNQAIMDFGAMICKPAAPLCDQCVFKKYCVAFLQDRVNDLPVKEKKITIKKRWFYYLVMEYKNEVLITQRIAKDIWQHLYEFPLVETGEEIDRNKMIRLALKKGWLEKNTYEVNRVSPVFRQQLSHQLITGQFLQIKLKLKIPAPAGSKWVRKQGLAQFTFPRFIHQWLRESTTSQSRSDLVIKG